jgi:chromodomain-helicase-DNA-binding protein 4
LIVARSLCCPVAAHWKCLAKTQQDEILRAVRDCEAKAHDDLPVTEANSRRRTLDVEETTEFICGELPAKVTIHWHDCVFRGL